MTSILYLKRRIDTLLALVEQKRIQLEQLIGIVAFYNPHTGATSEIPDGYYGVVWLPEKDQEN